MLQLRSVDAGYGSFQALFGISLEVNAGEAVAVIGPNGAGKTTLMRVISGLIRATSGSMQMEGTDLAATPAHRIVELGISHVPENRRLFARMTVEDNLRMGAYIPSARQKFRERLDFVYQLFPRLLERRHQLAGTMSGGEQQMCAIGRALMSEPKLLLLDEPSAGLAPVIVQQVFGSGGAHPCERAHRADRRTECPPGAARGGPRLCAGSRQPASIRCGQRNPGKCHGPRSLPGGLKRVRYLRHLPAGGS